MRRTIAALGACMAFIGCGASEPASTATQAMHAPTDAVTTDLSITGGDDSAVTVETPTVTISGTTDPIAHVSVAGREARVASNGRWIVRVPVAMGDQQLTISAHIAGLRDATATINVTRIAAPRQHPTPPRSAPRAAPAAPKIPPGRWAQSSFRDGYLAGRRDCSTYSVAFWAEQYGVASNVESVAAAFANEHGYYGRDPSPEMNSLARQAAYQGCLEGFQNQGNG